jgi:hypothetical protein
MLRVGAGGFVQMDDATLDGRVAVDAEHGANAKQSALGHYLPTLARKGYLRSSGQSVQSRARERKGGKQSLWVVTEEGVLWAKGTLRRIIPRQ